MPCRDICQDKKQLSHSRPEAALRNGLRRRHANELIVMKVHEKFQKSRRGNTPVTRRGGQPTQVSPQLLGGLFSVILQVAPELSHTTVQQGNADVTTTHYTNIIDTSNSKHKAVLLKARIQNKSYHRNLSFIYYFLFIYVFIFW